LLRPPFMAAEMLYGREELESLRDNIIILRDSALKNGDMQWAVILSHNVAVLSAIAKETDIGPL
jgi:hypothetical protein